MLSRLASRAVLQQWARGASSSAPRASAAPVAFKHPDIFENEKGPERDLVNFPRRKREINPGKVRHVWIPEGFFSFFYEKTGVTGPYMFIFATGTFLVSKEIWVCEHDAPFGAACVIFYSSMIKLYGPDFTKWLQKELDIEEEMIKSIRQDEIDRCQAAIAEEEKAQLMATSYEALIEAKKESVALQLEAEYRGRLAEAYQQVKRRLDYQLETANVHRRVEQRHMVDWIIGNVKKGITAKQEDDALKKCIADLKGLVKA